MEVDEHHSSLVAGLVNGMLDVAIHYVQNLSFIRNKAKSVLKCRQQIKKNQTSAEELDVK